MYHQVKQKLADIARLGGEQYHFRRLELQLKWYPVVMLLAWTGELVYRFHEYFWPQVDYSRRLQVSFGTLRSFFVFIWNSVNFVAALPCDDMTFPFWTYFALL